MCVCVILSVCHSECVILTGCAHVSFACCPHISLQSPDQHSGLEFRCAGAKVIDFQELMVLFKGEESEGL